MADQPSTAKSAEMTQTAVSGPDHRLCPKSMNSCGARASLGGAGGNKGRGAAGVPG